jgi:nucleotide-binding universal stress UspA family protein
MPASNAIIVGTDLSPHTITIIGEGLRLARALQGHLLLVHAVEPIEDPSQADGEIRAFHDQLIDSAKSKLRAQLQEWSEDVELQTSVELGSRVEVLVRLVREREARMLVMGSPFRGSGPPVGIGLQLMARCPCPVVIVP